MDIEVEGVAAATAVIAIVVKRKKKNRKKRSAWKFLQKFSTSFLA